jgi:hypothetical protein
MASENTKPKEIHETEKNIAITISCPRCYERLVIEYPYRSVNRVSKFTQGYYEMSDTVRECLKKEGYIGY